MLWPTALALAASAIAFALLALTGRLIVGPIGPALVQWTPQQLFRTYFLLDVLTYSALIGTLYAFYFYRQAASRELAASQLHASLAQARLRVLQAQLEPHFLFNTLNAISVLALEGNHKAVVETIGRLRELLRVSLSHDRPQEVSLARELELVEGYLGIQRVRFADRLVVAYDIAPDVLDAVVPSMILQPLVENAVTHGISADTGTCRVTIRAARRAGLAAARSAGHRAGVRVDRAQPPRRRHRPGEHARAAAAALWCGAANRLFRRARRRRVRRRSGCRSGQSPAVDAA